MRTLSSHTRPDLPTRPSSPLSTALAATSAAALIVLLTVLVPVSSLAAWSELEIGDSDRFVATMEPLASDPAVQDAVADRITQQAMRQIDVGPLEGQVRDLLHDAVRSFTTTASFRAAWRTASLAAQSAANQVLTEDTDKAVTLDLAPVTEQVKRQLRDDGVPFADRIPVRHTEITVLKADGLGGRRDVVQGLRTAGVWPAVGTLVVAVLAVAGAAFHRREGRRRRARRALVVAGTGFAAGGLLLFLAVGAVRGYTLDGLPNDGDRAAAAAVYDALTSSLRTTSWVVLASGLAVAVVCWFLGTGRAGRLWPRRLNRLRGRRSTHRSTGRFT
ncbi:hypothetical protein OG349_17560 [Streptomyces sp. NBC_01317]|uniref:hypothetical protein n=1 Tax=Streptomyces sp. NBC_01317 TaxID=2903822 RepID=UPI002E107825|nr:hypothetical protein OG349_17560 [Streptomyces sp. NBC_01317]